MSFKEAFTQDILKLISNVKPKDGASSYYQDLKEVADGLIASYSSYFDELETYEGLEIPKVDDESVLEGIKEKLRNNADPYRIEGGCVGADCPDYLYCDNCIFVKITNQHLCVI